MINMGILRGLKHAAENTFNKVKGNDYTSSPEQRAYNDAQKIKQKQELHEIRSNARFDEQKKIASERGTRSAHGIFSSLLDPKPSSGNQRKTRKGGTYGYTRALGQSLNNAERMFGMEGYGLGEGLDFGIGMDTPAPKKSAQRVTRISRSGTVIITEPAQSASALKKKAVGPRKNFFEEIDENNFFNNL